MKVKELKAKAAVDEITLNIESIEEPRTVRSGLVVANATGTDETGSVTITLWNDEVNKVKTGDQIKISKGWVGEYQGKLQLSAGKFGKLEVLSSGNAPAPKKKGKNEAVNFAIEEDII